MSDTTPPPASLNEIKTPAGLVSIYSLTLLMAGLGVACYLKNETAINLIIGAIITNAGTVVNYYMGSSRSSQTKDAVIAGQLPTTPAPSGPQPQPMAPK